ncbi:hypothetical protein [Nostoc punctiforme]|uniref:Uncharacterized protein n=1 Tax=Nostoc punctiforme (strain ATCC 29133 / PCC 73102) TaxID=63737 RepID=B2JBG3_NOSP7|nr:hypothetical protein [Nostoc punctiforme]ACC85267.1 hypothetical protein Npun_BR133 [Nostoc punctiforme PCC 73102]
MTVDAEFEAHKIADEQTKVQAELDQHIANLAQALAPEPLTTPDCLIGMFKLIH